MQRTLDITLDLLSLHDQLPERYPFLLQSVAFGTQQARYDILFAFPGEQITLTTADLHNSANQTHESDFLDRLDTWWSRYTTSHTQNESGLPFTGGWFLYLGYELVKQIEPKLELRLPPADEVIAQAVRIPAAILLDHVTDTIHLVAEAGNEAMLQRMEQDLESAKRLPAITKEILPRKVTEDDPDRYISGVNRIKDYIVEGDVFQVNLSRAWEIATSDETRGVDIYRSLRQQNPAPFAGIANIGNIAIISSSPERLIKVCGREIQTRPIAGTRPRSARQEADLAYSTELLSHPKENAEHVMLIDLERNDLGRVCVPGSVKVDEKMVLESYAHVHHIVSNIRGTLRESVTPGEVIRAVFPGGTITGCPKVRCMEIIAELEQDYRGAYTGSMGYLNLNGDMDLNILIRTVTQKDNKVLLRAGAGIVADSIAGNELEETRAKAKGMLLALGIKDL